MNQHVCAAYRWRENVHDVEGDFYQKQREQSNILFLVKDQKYNSMTHALENGEKCVVFSSFSCNFLKIAHTDSM